MYIPKTKKKKATFPTTKKAPKKKKPLPKQYDAPPGSKREILLRKAGELYRSGKKQQAFKMRNKMEEANAKSKTKK